MVHMRPPRGLVTTIPLPGEGPQHLTLTLSSFVPCPFSSLTYPGAFFQPDFLQSNYSLILNNIITLTFSFIVKPC